MVNFKNDLIIIFNIVQMFNSTFWTKYVFRVFHVSSLIVLCQAIINSKMTG